MSKSQAIDFVARGIGKPTSRYRMRAEFLFKGLDLRGKRVLDVGCGPGTYALWAAIHGADYVLGIEPEGDGSTVGSCAQFRSMADQLELGERAEISSAMMQDLDTNSKFDVIVMYNVINHLNEPLVTRLHFDSEAFNEYTQLLSTLRDIAAPGCTLIVADCGRENLWGRFGRKSPVAPSIIWDIHQEPELWARMLGELGFEVLDQRWSPWPPFPRLTANRLFNYLTSSHFVLRVKLPERASS